MSDETATEGTETETEKTPVEGETEGGESQGEGESEGGEGSHTEGEFAGEGEEKEGGKSESEPDWKSRFEESEKSRNEANEILVRALTSSGHDPDKAAREEREKLLKMTPEQRLEYNADKATRQIQLVTAQAEFKIKDANDRADFGIYCAKNPIAAKLAQDVEKRLAEERKRGFNYERKTLLTYLAGEKALASADKNTGRKQRAEAKEKIAGSTTSATPGKGDKKVNGSGRSESEKMRERMAGYKF